MTVEVLDVVCDVVGVVISQFLKVPSRYEFMASLNTWEYSPHPWEIRKNPSKEHVAAAVIVPREYSITIAFNTVAACGQDPGNCKVLC